MTPVLENTLNEHARRFSGSGINCPAGAPEALGWLGCSEPENGAYTNTLGSTTAQAPFKWSDLGVAAGSMNDENGLPSLAIVGSINLASAFPRTFNQKRFYLSDTLSYRSMPVQI